MVSELPYRYSQLDDPIGCSQNVDKYVQANTRT